MVSEEFAKCYTQRTSATANSPDLNINFGVPLMRQRTKI